MPDPELSVWAFEDTPPGLRAIIPVSFAGGWVIVAVPGCEPGVIDCLVGRSNSSGYRVLRQQLEDGATVLAAAPPVPEEPV